MGRNPYRPNYKKLYPNTRISPEVLDVLKKSDRKMEYVDQDLKQETFVVDQEAEVADLIPAREDSYERLVEEQHIQFPEPGGGFEDAALAKIIVDELLSRLPEAESALIRAIDIEGRTEQEYGDTVGLHKNTVNYHHHKILSKILYN